MTRVELIEMVSKQAKATWDKFVSGKIDRAEYNRRNQIMMNFYTRQMLGVKN